VEIIVTTWASAEIAKIAQNAFITMKITFANHLGTLCGAIPGANVDEVTRALGHDRRIGPHYLRAGTAYGGPCFPRDNKALSTAAERAGVGFPLATHVDFLNAGRTERLAEVVQEAGKGTVGILGMAYKPGTPVCEESAGLRLAERLLGLGRDIIVYDPLALEEARAVLGDSVAYAESETECIERADIVVLMHPVGNHVDPSTAPIVIDPWRLLAFNGPRAGYFPLGIGPRETEGVTA
jgi:UDPglucose 6-dehydrogenase